MHVRDRLIVSDPQTPDSRLAESAIEAGARGLVDATREGWRSTLDGLDPSRVVLRADPSTPPRAVGLAVIATWAIEPGDVPELRDTIAAWQAQGVPVGVEVRSEEEARRARDAGADVLVARGGEGPGRASDTSSLVLVPALDEFDLPVIAWGGAGPSATGALLVHADAVVLDAQLYGLDEAGLSEDWHRSLTAFDGGDVRSIGTAIGEPFYAMARPADEHVHELWEDEQAASTRLGEAALRKRVREKLERTRATWNDPPSEGVHALGHDAVHASFFAEFDSIDEVFAFLENRVRQQIDDFPLREDSPLAQAHGTELPVVQGAMANVSEKPEFAREVADAGGLPFLAFASLREHWAEELLEDTIEELGDAPFGCGIIGLDVNEEKRDAHMRLIKEHEPPRALIAAGTVEQATELENVGVDTYLHTPSRGLVRQAIQSGIENLVVEGNECGGHIGKLPSLVLWDVTLQEISSEGEPVNVLLAGGVSDQDTAAMAGTLAAGVDEARVGVLMGTAYLATEEIVETGAVQDPYQDLVIASNETEVTGDTVGIRARSAPTPFTERVNEMEREMVDEVPLDERKQRFEDENLGATRLAARGLERGEDGEYHEVPPPYQLSEGNYLMGQGAKLITQTTTIEDLHRTVTSEAETVAEDLAERVSAPARFGSTSRQREEAIAIVGLGCVFPGAGDVDTFWNNVLEGHVAIDEIPEDRWPIDPKTHLADTRDVDGQTYTVLGGFVDEDDVTFDPIEHRIPPNVAEVMDDSQKWAVQAAGDALEDAGLLEVEDRDNWAVILGNAMGGEQRMWTSRRLALEEAKQAIQDDASDEVLATLDEAQDSLPEINEDTMPGELANIVASRVCSVFDIGGPARTVDAACASTLAALEDAVTLLREDRVDVALTGGVDRSMDPGTFAKFSAIGALSPDGSFPFDEKASGFVMGEGAGCLVLKRLDDAIADGDRVYATIEGVGSSSDGSGKGITAPNPDGQVRAIESAYTDADVSPEQVGLIEAHGTGTPVGDPAEVETLERVLGTDSNAGLGSVKSNIGHLKAAAGAAGLIKAAKAIDEALMPPTVVEDPTSEVDWDTSPLNLVTEPTPWSNEDRFAGVSAFGFGGTNTHVVLGPPPSKSTTTSDPVTQPDVLGAASEEELLAALEEPTSRWTTSENDRVRVALAPDADVATAKQAVQGELPLELALRQGVAVGERSQGKLGFVFPGQGSQYPGMITDLAEHFPAAREVLARADQALTPLIGTPLSDILELEDEEGMEALTPTEVCQPAVLAADVAVLRVLEELGASPDVVAGHSLGEYAALVAAGAITFEDALHAVSARGREMADVEVDDPGGLIALETDRDGAEELAEGLDAWPANVNGPTQTVVAGTTAALEAISERADEADVRNSQLNVSAGFHSPIVAPASQPLRNVLDDVPFDTPEVPVISNATGEPYPEDPDAMRDLLAEQVQSPVEWVATMDAFDEMGVDLIVEVGPKPVLTRLAQANLDGVPAVPTMHPRAGETETFSRAHAALAASGHIEEADEPEPVQPVEAPAKAAPRTNGHHATASTPATRQRERTTVVTGVSVGLPGSEDPFGDETLQALLDGENRIQAVPDAQRERMANMGVKRLNKQAAGGPQFEPVDDPDDVVKLAGRVPEIDLSTYGVDEDWLDNADRTARLGVAAALEAISDARIPLVEDTKQTSTGDTLTDGWVLPEPMQEETGVILASAFPGYDSLVEILEGSKGKAGGTTGSRSQGAVDADARSSSPYGEDASPGAGASREGLTAYLADLMPHLEDRKAREAALDLMVDHADGNDAPAPREVADAEQEPFPRDFLFRTLGMGHAQVAQLIDARGPNLHVNAACASTTSALALAQDWIEQGRCERVIVLGADVAGNENLMPWIGGGFMAAGAASTEANVEDAALPFDQRRNGMLIGSGAVGLVVETASAADKRGVTPLAELAETRVANSAYHGSRLDPEHVADTVDRFVDDVCAGDLDRPELAEDLVFVSHEPATPPRGGSAKAEIDALETALGENASDVLVTNTKGLTGHAMGAGLEDGIAVELLRARQAPPVANLEDPDPEFEDFAFSQGKHTDRSRSVRLAAGFGSQVAMVLFERTSPTPGAVDQPAFDEWVSANVASSATVTTRDRLLRAVDADEAEPAAPARQATTATAEPTGAGPRSGMKTSTEPTSSTETTSEPAETGADTTDVESILVDLVSRKTGYPEDVIDPAMDLEADLGVDTVKQAEVLAEAREELGIPPIEDMSLSDVPTIQDAASFLAEHADGVDAAPIEATEADEPEQIQAEQTEPEPATSEASDDAGTEDVEALLVDLVSRKTGYPEDVIDTEMDLEADLGVDTVKQAEVLAEAREELGIPPIEDMSLSDVPTIDDAARFLAEHSGDAPAETSSKDEDEATEASPDEGPHVRATRLATAPASATGGPRSVGVVVDHGDLPDGLPERVADIVDDGETRLNVVGVDASTDPTELASLLERLQGLPEDEPTVLVAERSTPAADGLPALAGTLTGENRPTRAVIVDDVDTGEIAREVAADTDESVILAGEQRRRFALAPAEDAEPVDLEEGVVLAPGGLGAAVQPCLVELARERDLKIAVVGRSPIDDPGIDPDDEDEVQALREELMDQARESDDVTPADVENEVQDRVKRARRARALAGLGDVAEVRYERADATDPDELSDIVENVRENFGEPDLVVHGVGIDDSRAFDNKDPETMETVLSAKLTPVRTLADQLPEAHHVGFGSIAGVFGNPGQADYGLANGCLPAALLEVSSTVLHWTAWAAEGGMADDDSVQAMLDERGIELMDAETGAEIFTQRATTPGTFVVADRAPETPQRGDMLAVTGQEPWMQDHAPNDRPLLPGVRHLQAMREATTHAGRPTSSFHEIRFDDPVWATSPVELRVEATEQQVRILHDGEAVSRARTGVGPGVKPVAGRELDEVLAEFDRGEIDERMFHGESFSPLENAQVGHDRIVARADLGVGGAAPWAMALEASMQAAGLASDAQALPTGAAALSVEGPVRGRKARVDARRVAEDATGSTWDATVRVDGEPVLHARAIRLQRTDAMENVTTALIEAQTGTDATLRAQAVPAHDPRNPRAKRDAEHEAGQAAAERAAKDALGATAEITREDGRPVVENADGYASITHGHGVAIAAAHPDGPIGVDLEAVTERSQAWLEDNFTSAELELVQASSLGPDAASTLVWTLKEAASKVLGSGLDEPTTSFEVTELGDETARIDTPRGELTADWLVTGGLAVSIATDA